MPVTFADLGVPSDLVAALGARGITEAFPVQEATLPDALAGRDVCGRAPTGSGKTLAFGLPLVVRLAKSSPRRPRGLVLVPTRELAAQVAKELTAIAGTRRLSVACFYGGTGYDTQIRALRRGVDVAVCCPGRLEDLVERGALQLDEVELAVVDEADRMADMGFLPAVQRILDLARTDRQTLLFSATLDGDVEVLTRRYQRDAVRHVVAGVESESGLVDHLFWRSDRDERVSLTVDAVVRHGSAVVFCRTRHGADRLTKQLVAAGIGAVPIHGSRTQRQRESALAAFASGRAQALVATDVAARGIHVDDVACVVHYDPPADQKDYVHRSGRTGRAGAQGTVLSLVVADQVSAVRSLQRALGFPQRLDRPAEPAGPAAGRAPTPAAARAVVAPETAVAATPSRSTGTVKWFDERRGYGFVAAAAGGPDVFVHKSRLVPGSRPLREGDVVELLVGSGPRGLEASEVRLERAGGAAGPDLRGRSQQRPRTPTRPARGENRPRHERRVERAS
jgi:superfamily II DNA/RNA helicase/cold shock CspA family protein